MATKKKISAETALKALDQATGLNLSGATEEKAQGAPYDKVMKTAMNGKDAGGEEPGFDLSKFGISTGLDVISTPKQGGGQRNYTAVVKSKGYTAYVDFSLETAAIMEGKQTFPVVMLVARFIGPESVGPMEARQAVPGVKDMQRLSKFAWPVCIAAPGSYFLAKWNEQEISKRVAAWLLTYWEKSDLQALVTQDQLQLMIDNVTSEVQTEPVFFKDEPKYGLQKD